jgi:Double zinc ribbon
MDDLDRLYDRLLANIREGFPHLLDRAFQLGDVSEHLVPYRLNRRELGFDSVRQYELALMRLAAGEKGYLRADSAAQDAFRRALATPEPDGALLRDYARSSVALAQGSASRGSSSDAVAAAPSRLAADAAASPAPPADPEPVPVSPPPIDTPARTVAPTVERPIVESPAPMAVPEPPRVRPVAVGAPLEARPVPTVIGGPCRYCGQALPEGRQVTFCPHCGQNVTVRHCPACSTELDIGWHYCITCGRAMDDDAAEAVAG